MSQGHIVRRRLALAILIVLSALAFVAVTARLRLDPNVATLLPERGEASALRLYLRAFGGTDLAMALVQGENEDEVQKTAEALAKALEALPTVRVAAWRMDGGSALDPMLVWRHADAPARERLAEALTPAGMRKRLRQSRAMLLAPGAGAAAEQIGRDPLRLWQLLYETRGVASGFRTQPDGSFASDDGLSRLVLVFPEGQALRGDDARAFVAEATGVIDAARREHPGVKIGLSGGHAIAEATERMLMRDLTLSSVLSMVLASLAFALTFRRLRALAAVMPPLFLGTLWTAGLAALLPSGLSAIAVAFMSVVIGVGVDTGVHVYAALIEARQEGHAPHEAARLARSRTQRPVLVAAFTAAAAFASLALSEIQALRQLGILCAGGEVLTAVAIVVLTPDIGARLERKAPRPYRASRWTAVAAWLTATRPRALACMLLSFAPLVAIFAGYRPALAEAIVALRPAGLEPLEVQERVYQAFGGRRGQWVVLVSDRDPENARARADRVAEALSRISEHVDSVDAITAIAPAKATQLARFAARDALGMPKRAADLERALVDMEFAPERFEAVLESMRKPSRELIEVDQNGDSAIMLSRYLGRDGDESVVVLYVLPRLDDGGAHDAAVERAVHEADPEARLTGYGRLEGSLRESLYADMPRIGLVASLLVLMALAASLRRVRDVVLAFLVVAVEIALVLFLVRALSVPLHAYDALVLPVLLGITVDEGMFLLHRARSTGDDVRETLAREGPPIAATALTTAAGFAGLIVCDFDGLRHLGMVGALGSMAGLLIALVVVPAGLRLFSRT
ncbi:MAG TPA: MMPL family transporter [Polyangiaceae bacterium]|nr:MMPL family transporter [Polyangiaceae bacterium]